MKINDPLTQALAKTVKEVIAPKAITESTFHEIAEGKMKELHALMKKGVKDPKKIAKELGLASTKEVFSAIEALIKKETDYSASGKSGKAFKDLHLQNVDVIDDPEKEKQVESTEIQEGKFDKLEKKLGRINPETLEDVMDGKIKLNSAEKKEFDLFMKGLRSMFGESTEITEDVDNFFGFPTKDGLVKFQSMAKKLKIKPISNPVVMKRGGKEFHVMGFKGSVRDIEKAMKVAAGMQEKTDVNEIEVGPSANLDYDKKEESVQEATDLFDKGKISLTRFSMGKGKLGLQINYGMQYIQVPEKEINILMNGLKTAFQKFKKGLGESVEEELSTKQKKLDLNKNGKIDGEDLAKLRKGKKEEAPKPKGKATDVEASDDEKNAEDNAKAIKKSADQAADIKEEIEESTTYSEKLINKILEKKNSEIAEAPKFGYFNSTFQGSEKVFKDLEKDLGKAGLKVQMIGKPSKDPSMGPMERLIDFYAIGAVADIKKVQKKLEGKYELSLSTVPESVEESTYLEAIQPKDFIKGGDKKLSTKDVGDVMDRIFLNDRLMKQLEKTGAFKEGKKDKGKKKNPFKKDTIDFHHYELGVDAGQAGF